jgi:hypothetical protein
MQGILSFLHWMQWAAVPMTAMDNLGLGALGSLIDPVKRLSFSGS